MAAKSTRDGSDGEVTVRLWVKPSIETMFTQSMSFTHSAVRFQADVDPPLEMGKKWCEGQRKRWHFAVRWTQSERHVIKWFVLTPLWPTTCQEEEPCRPALLLCSQVII